MRDNVTLRHLTTDVKKRDYNADCMHIMSQRLIRQSVFFFHSFVVAALELTRDFSIPPRRGFP